MEWLNYHHLFYFWTVAREGSLRKASEKLHVSQPSISAQISALENAFGEKLFRPSGRTKVLTETGHLALGYAEEIFSLGREMMSALHNRPSARPSRFSIGVTDSVPKYIAYEIIRPVLLLRPAVQVICREEKMDNLLGQLATHRLDIVLSDEPAPSGLKFKTFSHLLGASDVTFCASPAMATKLRRYFPQSLHNFPALLPTENTAFRMAVESWFESQGIRPQIVAEFEDTALMHRAADDGLGFIPVYTAIVEPVVKQYGWKKIGRVAECVGRFHAITAERKLKHPATLAITKHAQAQLFA